MDEEKETQLPAPPAEDTALPVEDPETPSHVELTEAETAPAETTDAVEPAESAETELPAATSTEEAALPAEDPDSPVHVEVTEAETAPAPSDAAEAVEAPEEAEEPAFQPPGEAVSPEQLLIGTEVPADEAEAREARLLALLEAVVYITDEPLSLEQIATALREPQPVVKAALDKLVDEFNKPHHGLTVREVAGGYKMATKPEHHEAVRTFVKNLNPPLKLSLAALETLAVIAYKQPITAPEIMEIRGVQGAGVLKTLVDRKLITTAGRKNVVGKPILYKTTREFLVQFGLKDLNELPTLKEFEDLRRMAFSEGTEEAPVAESVGPESA